MNSKIIYLFVVLWFIHVLTTSGAGVAVTLRLWRDRDDWLAKLLIVLMGAVAVMALQAILLVFMTAPARSVRLNWKFTTTWFATTFVIDVLISIFAVGMIRARKRK